MDARRELVIERVLRCVELVPAGRVAGFANVGGYYMEEVRRSLVDKYGEDDKSGVMPNSVYGGGLWVRTSLDPGWR